MNLLILGGNSDIGLAITEEFIQKINSSVTVTLASRNLEELERNSSNLKIKYGVDINTEYFDVRDCKSHATFYSNLKSKPDGVIISVGYNGDQILAETNEDEHSQIIETNYSGVVNVLNIIADDFEQRSEEQHVNKFIIGLSSVAGERGRKKNYVYGSAKAGFTAYLSGLRQRLFPKGIKVITVLPGFVDTKMTKNMDLPDKLLLSPDLVARKVYQAYKKNRDYTYITIIWWGIITIIKQLPERLFKRLDL